MFPERVPPLRLDQLSSNSPVPAPKLSEAEQTDRASSVGSELSDATHIAGDRFGTRVNTVSPFESYSSLPFIDSPRGEAAAPKPLLRIDEINERSERLAAQDAKVNDTMLRNGTIWNPLQTTPRTLARGEYGRIDSPRLQGIDAALVLSARNLHALKTELGPLTKDESAFVERARNTPWYVTHGTSSAALKNIVQADGTLRLLSRDQCLKQRLINPDHDNTTQRDRNILHGTDYIYAGLEVGDDLKKGTSRFGDVILRAPLDDHIMHRAIVLPCDHIASVLEVNERLVNRKAPSDLTMNELDRLDARRLPAENFVRRVFQGPDIQEGLVLSAIRDLRAASPNNTIRPEVLQGRDEYGINGIINGLGRPQLIIPQELTIPAGVWQQH